MLLLQHKLNLRLTWHALGATCVFLSTPSSRVVEFILLDIKTSKKLFKMHLLHQTTLTYTQSLETNIRNGFHFATASTNIVQTYDTLFYQIW